jgi:hypothetical protein
MTPQRIGKTVRIISTGMTKLNPSDPHLTPTTLMEQALNTSLQKVNLNIKDLNGLIAVPSLAESHFMVITS